MKDVKELVSSLEDYAKGRTICLYTGHNTDVKCAEHLAEEMPMRCMWMHWNLCEPPIYVPVASGELSEEEIMGYVELLCRLSARMESTTASGDANYERIPGTDGILACDTTVSNDSLILVCIDEEYEELL